VKTESLKETSRHEELSFCFRMLAEPMRFKIIELLESGELMVIDIARRLDVTQPLLSHHLGLLRQSGLVKSRKDGRKRYYQLSPDRFMSLLGYLTAICRQGRGDGRRTTGDHGRS